MLLEKNAFDATCATPVEHRIEELLPASSKDDTRSQIVAACLLGLYLTSLPVGVLLFGPVAALAWALFSAPLAGAWVLYTTWFVPD